MFYFPIRLTNFILKMLHLTKKHLYFFLTHRFFSSFHIFHLQKTPPPPSAILNTFIPINNKTTTEDFDAAKVDEGFAGDDITELDEFQNLDSNLLKDNVIKLKNEKYFFTGLQDMQFFAHCFLSPECPVHFSIVFWLALSLRRVITLLSFSWLQKDPLSYMEKL